MNKKRAFISGLNGQDASYLSELLLEKNYEVYGIVRRNSISENQESRIHHLEDKINSFYGDLLDPSCLNKLFKEIQPDEIYHMGAQSHVRISYDIPQFTTQVNALGTLNMLEAYRQNCPNAKFYSACSSEQFGNSVDEDGFQRITTPMFPVSPYSSAKLYTYHITRIYRESYGLHACSGILFNHESPRRGSNFVTSKVVKGAVRIKFGLQDKLVMGNLDSYRDWSHSKDMVRAIHMILNHNIPKEWVVASGETYSVRDMCKYVFEKLGMNYQDYVIQDSKFLRPTELKYLKGDSTPIRKELGWKPEYNFYTLLDEMIEYWVKEVKYELIKNSI